jgi:predicted nucleic acid-binding protein
MATFVDTNVVVYAFDAGSGSKQEVAQSVLADPEIEVVLSAQVLTEFYWVVTRRLAPPLSHVDAAAAVEALAQLRVVATDSALVRTAVRSAERHQLALWDALIVEAAVLAGCDTLLTEDFNAGQVISGVEVVNPFA